MRHLQNTIFGLVISTSTLIGQKSHTDSLHNALAKAENDSIRYWAYTDLFYYYQSINRNSALYYADLKLNIARKNKKDMEIGTCLRNKSYILMLLGLYDQALSCFLEAFKILEDPECEKTYWGDRDNKNMRTIRLNALANLHHDFGHLMNRTYNTEQRVHHYLQAKNIAEKTGDKGLLYLINMNIGNAYRFADKLDSALVFEQIAEKIAKELDFPKYFGGVYGNMGNIYLGLGNISSARESFYKGVAVSKRMDNRLTLRANYIGLTKVFLKELNKDSSLHYALKAHEITIGMRSGIADMYSSVDLDYENISKAYKLNNRPDSAGKYLDLALKAKDSLYLDRIKNIAAFQNLNLAEKMRLKDLEKAQSEQLLADIENRNRLLLLIAALLIIILFFVFLFLQQRQQKIRAVEKAEAIHKMAELEMQSLRSQLNPHFMFNSLNSIQTLILKEDSDKSQSYLSLFARLLRMLLENAEKPFIPLQKEIEFLRLYLSLENLRVPDLQYSFSMDPDLNTKQTLIPNMILQPYVENAIWHGLSYKKSNKQLQIRINRDNGIIKYEIEDNGIGRQKAEELKSLFRKQHQSKGMELLSKRFRLLEEEYKSVIEIQVTDVVNNDGVAGTLVAIKVPIQLSIPNHN